MAVAHVFVAGRPVAVEPPRRAANARALTPARDSV